MLKPTGFWSYSTTDERASLGRLSQLRSRLASELQLRVGRTPTVKIFQDVAAIPPGRDWDEQIRTALDGSSFIIPVVSPALLQSKWCCQEIMLFRERELKLGRNDLIFPFHYVDIDHLDPSNRHECHDPQVHALLLSRQRVDFRELRLLSPESEIVVQKLASMAGAIHAALRHVGSDGSKDPTDKGESRTDEGHRDTEAKPQPEFIQDFEEGPKLVRVPAGRFRIGSPSSEPGRHGTEGPQQEIEFATGFAVGIFPVTFSEWSVALREGGVDHTPDDRGWYEAASRPVVDVSWDDAQKFVAWLCKKTGKRYRLPTEAEWEYVARAGKPTPFWWGDQISIDQANYDGRNTYGGGAKGEYRKRALPVRHFAENPWGLYQVHGNVWEWCEDGWIDNYDVVFRNGAARIPPARGTADEKRTTNPKVPFLRSLLKNWSLNADGKIELFSPPRVVRGGSWRSVPQDLRSARRYYFPQNYRGDAIGFRVVREL